MKYLFLLSFLWLTIQLKAQDKFQGVTVDYFGNAIELVSIVILDVDGQPRFNTLSDSYGKFHIDLPASFLQDKDSLFIAFYQIGKPVQEIHIEKEYAITNENIIHLDNKAHDLEEVTVTSNKPSIIQKSDTIHIDHRQYIDSTEVKVKDVLSKLPGVSVSETGLISYNGQTVSYFLIDGDDLLGENYGIGVNSLSSDIIQGIDIIKKFQKNKLFKGFKSSEEIAINIEVKDDYKHGWSLSGENGLGYGHNKIRWNIDNNTINLSNKIKHLYIVSSNNINDTKYLTQYGKEAFGNSSSNAIESLNKSPEYLDELNLQKKPISLPDKFLINSTSALADLNQIYTWTPNYKSHVYADLSGLNTKSSVLNQRILNDAYNTKFNQNENLSELSKFNKISIKNDYFPFQNLSLSTYSEYENVRINSNLNQSQEEINLTKTLQRQLNKSRFVNSYELLFKASNKVLIQNYLSYGTFKQTTDLSLTNVNLNPYFDERSSIFLPLVNQGNQTSTNQFRSGISLYLQAKVQSVFHLTYNLDQALGERKIMSPDSLQVLDKIYQQASTLRLHTQHKLHFTNKLIASFYPSVARYFYNDNMKNLPHINLWSFLLRLNYNELNKFRIRSDFSKGIETPNIYQLQTYPSIQDFRSIIQGIHTPSSIQYEKATLDCIYNDIPKDIFIKLGTRLRRTRNDIFSVPKLNGDFIELQLLNIRNYESIQGIFSFSTTSLKLKSKFYTDASYHVGSGLTKLFSSNESPVSQKNFLMRVGTLNNGKFIVYEGQLEYTQSKIKSNSFESFNKNLDLQNHLFLKIKNSSISFKHQTVFSTIGTVNHWFYAEEINFKVKKIFKKDNLVFRTSITNPLNRKSFNYVMISEIESINTNIMATERFIIFSVLVN